MKKIISLFAAILFAGSMMAVEVQIYRNEGTAETIDGITVTNGNFSTAEANGNPQPSFANTNETTKNNFTFSGFSVSSYSDLRLELDAKFGNFPKYMDVEDVVWPYLEVKFYKGSSLVQTDNTTVSWSEKNNAFKTYTISISKDFDKIILTGHPAYGKSSGGSYVTNYGIYIDNITLYGEGAAVAVTGIALDVTSKGIEVGESFKLTATISPSDATNKNVKWSTASTKASVDENGVVTGLAVGSATIWAKSEADNTITASCDVTVWPATHSAYVEVPLANIDQIKEQDEVVIALKIDSVANNGAVFALNGSGNNSPVADKVRVVSMNDSNSIKTVTDDHVFHMIKVGTDGYRFVTKNYADTLYAFANGDDSKNDDVRVAKPSGTYDDIWKIDENNHIYTTPSTNDRFLCVYSSADFRTYKKSSGNYNKNVKDQSLHFYVKKSPATAIDETEAAGKATKELREGQVLIIKGNKTYNILGQEIK